MALKNFTQFTPQTVLSATDFVVGYRALDEIRTDLDSLTVAISGLLISKGFTPGGSLGSVRRVSYRYTIGTGSPVNAVSGADDFGLTLTYSPGQIEVYRNGAHLIEGLDFLATNSTQVRNLSTLNVGDSVEIVALSATGVTVNQTLTGSGAIIQSNYRYTVPTTIANGATIITGNDDFGSSLRYAAPNLAVYLNGSHLVNSYDFTATDGFNITLNEPVATGDVVDVQTLSSVGTGAVFGLSAFAGVSRIVAQNGVATGPTGGLGIVTLSADIQGRTLKSPLVAGDEVMIYDSVAKDNKKTTIATLTSLGGVQQSIMRTASAEVTHNSSTYVDTGLSASFVAKSTGSKAFIIFSQMAYVYVNNPYTIRLLKNGTSIYIPHTTYMLYPGGVANVQIGDLVTGHYLDPETLVAGNTYNYVLQAASGSGQSNPTLGGVPTSTITVMEIK